MLRSLRTRHTFARKYSTRPPLKRVTRLSVVIPNTPGSAQQLLSFISKNEVNLSFLHIQTRNDLTPHNATAAVIEIDGLDTDPNVKQLLEKLGNEGPALYHTVMCSYEIPWVPTALKELDLVYDDCLYSGSELASDHPGFNDEQYKTRRKEISKTASVYQSGQPIPTVSYTPTETATWSAAWDSLTKLHSSHTCFQYQEGFLKLVANTSCRRDNIPQLQELAAYLNSETGFTLRPVTGLLSSRHFLAGLALRVFHSTQYIRHHAKPFYTPEPDVVHEVFGHVPMFLDPAFADFSQAIGVAVSIEATNFSGFASLGASDEFVKYLAACYWYTVEFGLIKQRGTPRAFGAGLLSSVSEMENALSGDGKSQVLPFDPFTIKEDYPITEIQPIYYLVEDFTTLAQQIQELARVRNPHMHWEPVYNPHSKTISFRHRS